MVVSKVVPLAGQWKIDRGNFEFSKSVDHFGIALCNQRFARGSLTVSVSLDDSREGVGGLVLDYDPAARTGIMVTIGGWGSAYAIGEFQLGQIGTSASSRALLGDNSSLEATRAYALKATVEGVALSLEVDGAVMLRSTLPRPLRMQGVGVYAYGSRGKVRLSNFQIDSEMRKAFVVMPFREPFETFWREVIEPVAKTCKYVAYRVKDVYKPGVIIDDVTEGLKTSDVVIADVGTLNPSDKEHIFNANVYYEVGYAHRAGTPVILMADQRTFDGSGLPFDIHHFRCIPYTDTISGKKPVEDALKQHLQSLL
jgi:hypothetical protein